MASGTRLELEFADDNGKSIFFVFDYANPGVTSSNVKALMKAIIDNGTIFSNIPVTAKSAKTVTSSEYVHDLE